MATRTLYAREFKLETVTLVTEQGLSRAHVARDMGIDAQTLRKWMKHLDADRAQAFPGQGHPRDQELVRLRREDEQLRHERAILKKALDIFSWMPQCATRSSLYTTMRAKMR